MLSCYGPFLIRFLIRFLFRCRGFLFFRGATIAAVTAGAACRSFEQAAYVSEHVYGGNDDYDPYNICCRGHTDRLLSVLGTAVFA